MPHWVDEGLALANGILELGSADHCFLEHSVRKVGLGAVCFGEIRGMTGGADEARTLEVCSSERSIFTISIVQRCTVQVGIVERGAVEDCAAQIDTCEIATAEVFMRQIDVICAF